MLEIQKFIDQFDSIETANIFLKEKLNLKITKHVLTHLDKMYDDIVYLYNYNPEKSPLNNTIVQEANGLILDDANRLVSKSFNIIPHIYEKRAPKINWNKKRVKGETKYDGTLVVLYHWNGDCYIQTINYHPSDSMAFFSVSTTIISCAFLISLRAS